MGAFKIRVQRFCRGLVALEDDEIRLGLEVSAVLPAFPAHNLTLKSVRTADRFLEHLGDELIALSFDESQQIRVDQFRVRGEHAMR